MNCRRILATLVAMLIFLLGTSQATGQQDEPQSPQDAYGSAFTYQGQLRDGDGPVNGACDLRFSLWDADIDGVQVGNTLTWVGAEIADGLFTARLDFGGWDVHDGNARWLEVAVRCPAGSGEYVTLDPRQELTAAPAALSLVLPFRTVADMDHTLASFWNNGGGDGAFFGSGAGNAVGVYSENAAGLKVFGAGTTGVSIDSAGEDGVVVGQAGNPSETLPGNGWNNGFQVDGAEGAGFYVGRADWSAVMVNSTGLSGLQIESAGTHGVYVAQAGADGVRVIRAGNPSANYYSPDSNGFEVEGAEGSGVWVGRADWDGLFVLGAGNDGVEADGDDYAGSFWGNIYVDGDCHGCTLAVFGLNAADSALQPGQIVAMQGIQATRLDNAPTLWRVVPAREGTAAVGVVRGKAELDQAPAGATLRDGKNGQRLVPRAGAAQPGEYLSIVIYGPMQVRAGAQDGPIGPGTRLAVDEAGAARALKTVVVEGIALAESAPTVGIALTAPDGKDLVWVLVNPR